MLKSVLVPFAAILLAGGVACRPTATRSLSGPASRIAPYLSQWQKEDAANNAKVEARYRTLADQPDTCVLGGGHNERESCRLNEQYELCEKQFNRTRLNAIATLESLHLTVSPQQAYDLEQERIPHELSRAQQSWADLHNEELAACRAKGVPDPDCKLTKEASRCDSL